MEPQSTVGQLLPQTKRHTRGKGSTDQQAAKRTAGTNGNGFLNHSFSPVWACSVSNYHAVEKEYFTSLQNLCNLHNITAPDVSSYSFPENIAKSYEAICNLVSNRSVRCYIMRDRQRKACLTTINTYNTDSTLFYIPVRPLWYLRQNNAFAPLADLFTCLFAYLYQTIKVPYFEYDSYLGSVYRMIGDWIRDSDEEDEDYLVDQLTELQTLQTEGAELLTQICEPFSLERLRRLTAALGKSKCRDDALCKLAQDFIKLAKAYPSRSINDCIISGLYPREDTIRLEQYLSFYWSSYDNLSDQLTESVNCDFQELGEIEEPCFAQYFDTPQKPNLTGFDFPKRLFRGITDLIDLLNKYEDEKYKPRI